METFGLGVQKPWQAFLSEFIERLQGTKKVPMQLSHWLKYTHCTYGTLYICDNGLVTHLWQKWHIYL